MSDADEEPALQALHELVGKAAESPQYYAMMKYRLEVQARPFGDWEDGVQTITLHLTGMEISSAYHQRIIEVVGDEWMLYMEADHRGPEHGVDAWLGEPHDASPKLAVLSVDIVSEVKDE